MSKLTILFCIMTVSSIPADAQWKQLDVGAPGRVNVVDVIGNDVFAGTNAGIFKSTDNGQTWKNVSNAFTLCFAAKGSEILAGTMDEGVVLSTDGGNTWLSRDSAFTRMVRGIAVRDSEIYAGGDGMFKSTDDGANWITIENGMQGYQSSINGIAVDGNKVFATTVTGLMLSTDEGESWTQIGGNDLSVETTNCIGIYDSTVIVGTTGGTVRSTDGGHSWYDDNSGFPKISGFYTPVLSIAVDSFVFFVGTSSGVFASTDSGASWVQSLSGNQVLSVAAKDTTIFAGTFGDGVFASTDNGAKWKPVSKGIVGASVNSIAGNGANIFAVMNNNSLFVSTDNGRTWVSDTSLPSRTILSVAVIDSDVFAMTAAGIFMSSDNGSSWDSLNGGIMNTKYPKLITRSGSNLIVATEPKGLFVSSDMGASWNNVNDTLSIASFMDIGSEVFAGGHQGIFVSSDYGEHWVELNDSLININAFAVSGSSIFAGRYWWPAPILAPPSPPGNVFRSTDNGETWMPFNSGLPIDPAHPSEGIQVYQLAVHGQDIFAGLDPLSDIPYQVLYSSTVTGNNWINIGKGLPDETIFSLFINDSDVFVGTQYAGIWKRPISQVTSVRETIPPTTPASFLLEQNYPNPFNPSTTISYQLSAVSHVKLIVYDILGRKVETLVDAKQNPGIYRVSFNASALASGVYFYRLQAGSYYKTMKLMVLK